MLGVLAFANANGRGRHRRTFGLPGRRKKWLAPRQGITLVHKIITIPLVVCSNHLFPPRFFCGAGFCLSFYQVGVGGEELHTMGLEVLQPFEVVLLHTGQQLFLHCLDHGIAKLHHSGTDLNGIGT